jgi:ATP-dependent DNA ligase
MAEYFRVESARLDGEIVHLDAVGRPQFFDLLRRQSPQHLCAFDVLLLMVAICASCLWWSENRFSAA